MSLTDTEPDFEYDGYLVFNGLYETNVLDADFDFEEIVDEKLKDYSRGSIDSPSDGYEPLDFGELANESRLLSQQLQDLVSNVRAIRHKYEEWEERQLADGETEPTLQVRSYDVYWDFPKYIVVKGDKTQSKRAQELLNLQLGEYITSREIEFEPDFLLWVFYKDMEDEPLTGNLSTSLLSDAYIEGEEDRYGKEVSVDRSTDITQSTNILSGILRNRELIGLEGIFDARGHFVKANVEVGGRVHIKVAQAIEEGNDLERITTSIVFLRDLLDAYLKWEGLSDEDKYPPPRFFETVYEECKRQGEEPTFPLDPVIGEYQAKRAGTHFTSGIEQSGIGDFGSEREESET